MSMTISLLFLMHKYSPNFLLIKKKSTPLHQTHPHLFTHNNALLKHSSNSTRPGGEDKLESSSVPSATIRLISLKHLLWHRSGKATYPGARRLVKGRWVNRLFLAVTYSLHRICTDGEIRVRSVGYVWLCSSSSFRILPDIQEREHDLSFLLILFVRLVTFFPP